jgi:hypothetical protein
MDPTSREAPTPRNDAPAADPTEESNARRDFLRSAVVATSGLVLGAGLADKEAEAAVFDRSALIRPVADMGNVSLKLNTLREIKDHDAIARGAITNEAINIVRNLGGAASDFSLSFSLSWKPADLQNEIQK